jgi:hypothetical protein
VSGFDCGRGRYSLTATKADYWHGDCACGASTLAQIVAQHAVPAGFSVVRRGTAHAVLSGPGLAQESTEELYAAVTGRS